MKNSKLHIYGQVYNHDHAFIVGNTEALTALREAIDAALETGSAVGTASSMAADREGYEVKVFREEDDSYWDKAKLPYTDNDIFVGSDNDISPWDLFRKYTR
jgi:hypothetical protein